MPWATCSTERYARAIHDGFHPYNNTGARPVAARQFLSDAAESVDTGTVFRRGVAKALGLPA